jgi:hypothetical protein
MAAPRAYATAFSPWRPSLAHYCANLALRFLVKSRKGGAMQKGPERYRVGHGGYVSEYSKFIDSYLHQHPEVLADQLDGWYIWWDHQVDLKELEKAQKDSVPLPPYYYP